MVGGMENLLLLCAKTLKECILDQDLADVFPPRGFPARDRAPDRLSSLFLVSNEHVSEALDFRNPELAF